MEEKGTFINSLEICLITLAPKLICFLEYFFIFQQTKKTYFASDLDVAHWFG